MDANPRVLINGVPANGNDVIMPIAITHGRSRAESQPDAPTMTLIWRSIDTAPLQGDEIAYWISLPAAGNPPVYDDTGVFYDDPRVTYGGAWLSDVPRFVGTVTDVTVNEWAGWPGAVSITAVSRQADLGRIGVLLSRPAEDDVARIQAIAAAVPIGIQIHGNPGPLLTAYEIDTDALSALHEVCDSSAGLVWSDTAGELHYGTADHRAIAFPIAAIPAHAILSGLDWDSTLNDLINRITMNYGTAQESHTLTDDVSIARYGIREKSASTLLAHQAAADQIGNVILARRAWPYSRISDVMMDSDHVSDDAAALYAAINLRISDAVLLPIPPDPGPTGQLAEWIIEGWQEEWDTPNHVRLQFAVTDRARFAQTTLRKWDHADEFSWQEELDRGAWLDTLILRPGEPV